jgi:hypothetical protein
MFRKLKIVFCEGIDKTNYAHILTFLSSIDSKSCMRLLICIEITVAQCSYGEININNEGKIDSQEYDGKIRFWVSAPFPVFHLFVPVSVLKSFPYLFQRVC